VNPKQNKKEGKMIVAGNSKLASASLAMRALLLAGAFAGLAAFMAHEVHARPGGGGFRGGAGFSGLQRPSGFGGFQRPSGGFQRPGTAAGQRPNGQAARSGNFQGNRSANGNMGVAGNRSANGNTGIAGNRTGNTGVAGNGNGNSNSGAIGSGNGNTGVVGSGNVNNGNVAVGNDVDVNVGNTGWAGGYYGYPAGSGSSLCDRRCRRNCDYRNGRRSGFILFNASHRLLVLRAERLWLLRLRRHLVSAALSGRLGHICGRRRSNEKQIRSPAGGRATAAGLLLFGFGFSNRGSFGLRSSTRGEER
jgi:hypothetical protein